MQNYKYFMSDMGDLKSDTYSSQFQFGIAVDPLESILDSLDTMP